MAKRRPADPELTGAFFRGAMGWCSVDAARTDQLTAVVNGRRVGCWLWQFDELERPCSGCLEAFHFISRQRVRNVLWSVLAGVVPVDALDDIIEAAEWDPRNGGPACTEHHRRFDSHATPRLWVPGEALMLQTLGFVTERGLELEAERKFNGEPVERVIEARITQLEKHWGHAHVA